MRTIIFLVFFAFAPLANAGLYIKAGTGNVSYTEHNNSGTVYGAGSGTKISVGYMFKPGFGDVFFRYPDNSLIGFEWSFINFGPATINGGADGYLSMYAESFSAVANLFYQRYFLSAKVGLIYADATTNAGTIEAEGFNIGMDVGYMLNQNLGVYLDGEIFQDLNSVDGAPNTAGVYTIGLRYMF